MARYYLALAANEKDEGQNAWNYISLVEANYFLKDYQEATLAFIMADQTDIRIAYLSKDPTVYGAIALIKTNELETAKCVLLKQAELDKDAVNLASYKEAVRLYEAAAGNPLHP